MDFSLSEEQEMLKSSARKFLETECTESYVRKMEKDQKGYSSELWHKTAELGWLGLVFPEKYGGTGNSIIDMAVLYEEMGRAMLPGPYLSTSVLGGLTLLNAGSEAQKAQLLPKITKGDVIIALALTEPSARWDAAGVDVTAKAKGNNYIINGTKLFVHDAHIADYLLCVTKTRNTSNAENNITLFLVDAKSPGIKYTLLKTTAGDNKQSEVIFDNVAVPKENMVGKLNGGWSPLEKVMQIGAVMVCAQMVGASRRMLEITVDYAKSRVQFDEPIGINQYVQEHCVNLLACADSSGWITYQAAWKLSENLPCDMEVAMAKAWTSESHEEACWYAHQVFAGVGYTMEIGLPPLYSRRGKILQLYLGDAAYHREKIAQQLEGWTLEMPKGKPLGIFEQDQIPAWDRKTI